MPFCDEREYRELPRVLEIRATAEEGEEEKIVEGYATTFDDPYLLFEFKDWDGTKVEVWESIDKNSFDNCDMSDVIMQYNHKGRVFARTRNGTLKVEPDEKGLFTSADLGGTDIGRQLYQEIKGGYTDRMSFAFIVNTDKWEFEEDREAGVIKEYRTITSFKKLYDVSAVPFPANENTSISSRASVGEGVITRAKEEFQKRQKIEARKRKLRIRANYIEREV